MRLYTWNMDGSNAKQDINWQTGVANILSAGGADVVCLQECGQLPYSKPVGAPPFLGALPTAPGTLHGFKFLFHAWGSDRAPRFIFFMETDPVSRRVNLAVVSKTMPANLLSAAPGYLGARPAIGVRVAATGGNFDLFSIHAHSPLGNDAKNLLANVAALGSPKWAVLGDFNREPGQLMVPTGALISAPTQPTRQTGKRTLDYMVGPQIVSAEIPGLHSSDHWAVRFDL